MRGEPKPKGLEFKEKWWDVRDRIKKKTPAPYFLFTLIDIKFTIRRTNSFDIITQARYPTEYPTPRISCVANVFKFGEILLSLTVELL